MADADRRILHLALPALGALAAEPLYVLADAAIVGHIGTVELAGLAVAGGMLSSAFWLLNFLSYATTARVARLGRAPAALKPRSAPAPRRPDRG